MVGQLVGWLVGWLVGLSVGRLVGWSVGRSVGPSETRFLGGQKRRRRTTYAVYPALFQQLTVKSDERYMFSNIYDGCVIRLLLFTYCGNLLLLLKFLEWYLNVYIKLMNR